MKSSLKWVAVCVFGMCITPCILTLSFNLPFALFCLFHECAFILDSVSHIRLIRYAFLLNQLGGRFSWFFSISFELYGIKSVRICEPMGWNENNSKINCHQQCFHWSVRAHEPILNDNDVPIFFNSSQQLRFKTIYSFSTSWRYIKSVFRLLLRK